MRTSRKTSGMVTGIAAGAALLLAALAATMAPGLLGNNGPGSRAAWAAPTDVASKPVVDPKVLAERMEKLTKDVTQGALRVVKEDGQLVECPLKHTDVKADVSGFIARVKVTQTFLNPLKERIEAVYVFPLPHQAAVDDMTMVLSSGRRVVGIIKRRAEAREIYEQAIAQGATAALLEQERPNIFTQTVGNIDPGEQIDIEISYVDVLAYDMGTYEFHFPMVVGPRYIPGGPTSKIPPVPPELQGKVGELDKEKVPEGPDKPKGDGWSPDTTRVPDASRITPPVLKPEFRNGHDISLEVKLDAGVPVQNLAVVNHKCDLNRVGVSMATARILPADSIPNKDFVLRYDVVGEKPEMALLAHTDPEGQGYFMLMIQPREDEKLKAAPPREIVFLIDVSGSMRGQPSAKVRETMEKMLERCKADDTVQVVAFQSSAEKLFEAPVPATKDNIATALDFTNRIQGRGGTEMLKGVRMALDEPPDPKRVRICLMLTDGFIGNEAEIIEEVGKRCGDQVRFWCLGIGNSVNRFLVDGVARQGGGMGKVMNLNEDPAATVEEIMMRIHRAQLSKVAIDWGGAEVSETYPAKIPELWVGRPIILFGRYAGGRGEAPIRVSGRVEGEPVSWPLVVNFPAAENRHAVLAKVWARNKVEDLMQSTYYAGSPAVEEEVTRIALDYRLMSQYTSFVAVDETELGKLTEPARPPRRMLVPVPIPEGTRYEGFFGPEGEGRPDVFFEDVAAVPTMRMLKPTNGPSGGGGGGSASYFSVAGAASAAPPPASMPATAAKPQSSYGYGYGSAAADAKRAPARTRESRKELAGFSYRSAGRRAESGRMESLAKARVANGPVMDRFLALGDMEQKALRYGGDPAMRQWFAEASQAAGKHAEETAKAAQELAKDDASLLAARAAYAYTYLLKTVAGSDGDDALVAIDDINAKLLKAWSKDVPALEKRLDLVIRDKSLAEALKAVAGAAGVEVKLIPGSVEDAAAMTGSKETRVTWLDLRRATVAEALDWLLTPERLTWQVTGGEAVVISARRAAVKAPWVYDVSLMVPPEADELKDLKEWKDRAAALKKAYAEFLKPVREKLGLAESDVAWYGAGQLVVFAEPATHEATAKLFADLADAKAELEGDLAELHKVTCKRAEARKERAAKVIEIAGQRRVAVEMYHYGWQLLAEAADGRLDLQALTHLQVAWRAGEAADLLKNEAVALVPLRSMWAISESARSLPGEAELAALAKSAGDMCRDAARKAVSEFDKSPKDYAAQLRLVYAALARRESDDVRADAQKALGAPKGDDAYGQVIRTAVAALLATDKVDQTALADAVSQKPAGEDAVVLVAMACRKAGGEAWRTFRAESQQTLGRQPLSGTVVVLISRLSATRLPLVAAAK